MKIQLVFETHAISVDNELEIATGWLPGKLSAKGWRTAQELGERRRDGDFQAVFCSDLRRAIDTAEIAFGTTAIPIFHDWRLRECNYGEMNGSPCAEVHKERQNRIDQPYPGGESWRQAVARVWGFLNDLPLRWEGCRVLVIGHVATRWAFEHYLNGVSLPKLVDTEFVWREGWEYIL